MRFRSQSLVALATVTGLTMLPGCGSPEPTLQPTPAAAPVAATKAATTPTPPEAKPPQAKPSPESAAKSAYRAPFPKRVNPFAPMRRIPANARSSDNDSGESVVLKGFAIVDEPKVVLAIDGVVTPIGAGGERYGVQVISIEPPEVVLQRGRSRWTATLQ